MGVSQAQVTRIRGASIAIRDSHTQRVSELISMHYATWLTDDTSIPSVLSEGCDEDDSQGQPDSATTTTAAAVEDEESLRLAE